MLFYIEVSNIYPDNLIKQFLRANQRSLISYLRSEAYSICRTEISYDYIKSVFNKFKKGLSDKEKNYFEQKKLKEEKEEQERLERIRNEDLRIKINNEKASRLFIR